MIELDGAYGEGGGQLVRLAVALAALSGKPARVFDVRARRKRPGLGHQHLAAVRAVAAACDARCENLALGSRAFAFEPRAQAAGGDYRVEVGTAGSVTLVLQAILPVLVCARRASRVTVTGGTDVREAPTWDYFDRVHLRLLARMGLRVGARALRRGYYPAGGGEVCVEIEPGQPSPPAFGETREAARVEGEAQVARLPVRIAERMREAALAALGRRPAAIGVRALDEAEAAGPGGAITLWTETEGALLGASRIAERGVRAETLGAAVGAELAADLAGGANLDVHGADQALVYLALARQRSAFTVRAVSEHARTAMWLIERFLPVRFSVEPMGALRRVRCEPA
ncbi:MAG: RNA 3'-terminal phosphate cyclase [Burkholderiales bacterium]|nr:RNA 3'-terminal phosphate cyclase [Burkholderiales bacterium]